VFGVLRSNPDLHLPERHLGLVQANEHAGLEAFIETAATAVEAGCDLPALLALAQGLSAPEASSATAGIAPLSQHIAVARDIAFAFSYPHLLEGWRRQGAELSFFSPLADEAPSADAGAVYLPGGYPELHAGRLAGADTFKAGMVAAVDRGGTVYGECGGYMVLGDGLIDGDGHRHAMLGLLPLVTSYAVRTRHLGYRRLRSLASHVFAGVFSAHEFHYSSVVSEGAAERLFEAEDATGDVLGAVGLRLGKVCGSYMHLIDRIGEAV
jgi:cobyrinic acid a,c-diamide synthase